MNRQQKRQQERQIKKELKKKTNELDRTGTKTLDKKKVEASKWVMSLSKEECNLMHFLMTENSKIELSLLDEAYVRVLDAYLEEHNLPYTDIDKIHEQIAIEGNITRNYADRGEEYIMKIAELKPQIINRYEELKKEGKADKEIMNTLTLEFSQISTNAVKKTVNEYKRSKVTDKDIEKAVESIFEEPKSDEVVEKDDKASQSNLSKEKVKTTSKSLKVKSLIVEDEEGTEYVKENNTVKVGTMTFENEKDVEDFRNTSLKEYKEGHDNALSERRKQYEEEIAEINRAYEEEKIKFLKKVNNILDVMSM